MITKLGVFTHCGREFRWSPASCIQQKCRFSLHTQCQAAQAGQLAVSKLCPKCQSLLPVEEFNRYSSSADGRQKWCRKCMSEYKKMRSQIWKTANMNRGRPPDDEQVFCPKCQRTLPAAEFSTNLMRPNRLVSQCKACEKLRYLKYAAMNEQRTRPSSFPMPSALELQEAVGLEDARDRNEALSTYGMYFCPRCRRPKCYEAFSRDKHNNYGVSSRCTECLAELRRKREKTSACVEVLLRHCSCESRTHSKSRLQRVFPE